MMKLSANVLVALMACVFVAVDATGSGASSSSPYNPLGDKKTICGLNDTQTIDMTTNHGFNMSDVRNKSDCAKSLNNKFFWERAYPITFQTILNGLESNVNKLSFDNMTDQACRAFMKHVDKSLTNPSQFSKFRMECSLGLEDSTNPLTGPLIKAIPATEFASPLAAGFLGMNASSGRVYDHIKGEQAAVFFEDPRRCVALEKWKEDKLSTNLEAIKKIKGPCLKKINLFTNTMDITTDSMQKLIRNIPKEAWQHLSTINENILPLLKSDQVVELDAQTKTERRCANIDLNRLDKSVFEKIDPACLAGRLNNVFITGGDEPFKFGEKAAKLKVEQLAKINVFDQTAKRRLLLAENVNFLSAPVLAFLLDGEIPGAISMKMPTSGLQVAKLPTITAGMFAAFEDDIANLILEKGYSKLDNAALSSIGANKADKYKLDNVIKHRPALLKALSASYAVGPSHYCSKYELSDYEANKTFFKNASVNCIRSVRGLDELANPEVAEEVVKKAPSIFFAALRYDQIKANKHIGSNFWSTMTADVFAVFGTAFNCGAIEQADLALVNPTAFAGMTNQCVSTLKGQLTIEQVQAIPASVLGVMDKSAFERLNLNATCSLTPAQLADLSALVTDPGKHAGAAFTAATIGSLTPAHISALTPSTIKAIPASAFTALTPELFAAMDEGLRHTTAAQIGNIPETTLINLTGKQATALVSSPLTDDTNPRRIFTAALIGKLKDEAAKQVLSGSSMIVVSVMALLVSAAIGLLLA